ncbi:MAG: radical SAM protein [Candidatus Omnitrophota bacterium]
MRGKEALLSRKKFFFKYIYGPVFSWRLGVSLGIDLFSCSGKICNFDCIYCQLGNTLRFTNKADIYVPVSNITAELEQLPRVKIDYLTFSGMGEPTLAKNLGRAIKAVKSLRLAPVAVLTNSALIGQPYIRENLSLADFVIAKLDAHSQECLDRLNRPAKSIRFKDIVQGLKNFRKDYKGKFALQIMFVEENKNDAAKLLKLAQGINPDEVQINTPRRPCKERTLSKEQIAGIREDFSGLNVTSVYDIKPKKVVVFDKKETLRRRR